MDRIIIIGCPGSGKTPLADALSRALDMPVVHLDMLWWTRKGNAVTQEEFDARLDAVLEQDKWIIDGNFGRTMPMRIARCDTIIYLDFDRIPCLWGAACRFLKENGLGKGNAEAKGFDRELIKYIWNYNKNNRSMNRGILSRARHARTVILRNRKDVREFLQKAKKRN